MQPPVRWRISAVAARFLTLAVIALIAVAASALPAGCSGAKPVPATSGTPGKDPGNPAPKPAPPTPLSPITGKPVVKPGSPVAVSVDNHPDARPQSGLARADIIYEALAEGGITRYLAIFCGQAPAVIGPVRSARPYFVLLAKEWGAVFAHCGGDPKDIQPIRDWNVVDADEFKRGELYWRDKTEEAPHNLYTSVDNLRKVTSEPLPAPEKRYEFQSWTDNPVAGLEVRYARGYAVQYKYAGGKYERWILDGNSAAWQYRDRDTNEKPEVANVIVQFTKSRIAYSDGGLIIDLVGEGKSAYLLGGRLSEGRWKKESLDKPTFFYDAQGKRIVLSAGQTWVQIVPEDARVTALETR